MINKIFNFVIPLFILIVTFSAVGKFIPGLSFSDFSLFRSEKTSTSVTEKEIKDLYVLNTTEYKMKMIFPFDFTVKEFDWWKVKEIYEEKQEIPENLIEEVNLYRACLNAGFDPAVDYYEFIVITAVVKAGIRLSGTIYDNSEIINESDMEKPIKIEVRGNGEKIISVYIPELEITDYYIEDRRPGNDNFPDASLTPKQWKDLVDFLNPLIQDKVIELGILENARVNSELLIERILKDSGFSEVNFIGKDL